MSNKENQKSIFKNNLSKHKTLVFVVVFVWALTVFLTLNNYSSTLGYNSSGCYDTTNIVELNSSEEVIQELTVGKKTNTVGIKFATYRRNNCGNVTIEIKGCDSNIVYYQKTINVKTLSDNEFYIIDLEEELNDSKDKKIKICLKSDSNPGEAVGIYYGDTSDTSNVLMINNSKVNGTLTHVIMIEDETLNKFNSITLISVITIMTILVLWLLLFKPDLSIFFTIFVFAIGLVFMVIISPLSPPDETIHLEFSLQESSKITSSKDIYDIDSQYIDYMASRYYSLTKNDKEAYRDIIENLNIPYEEGKNIDYYDVGLDETYSIPFLPQAIGLAIGETLKLNPIKTFYLGRITNLLFYVLCVYICLKNVPVHKVLFGIIVSLPIMLQQAASYSYDSFINGLCFVIIAYLFKWLYKDENIQIKDYVIAFVACLLIAPAKYIYGFLVLLYWLVPNKRYGSKRKKILLTLLLCLPMLIQLLPIFIPRILYLLNHFSVVNAETLSVVEEKKLYTMSYVASHFSETISIVARTVRYNLRAWFHESIGRYLSELTLILPLSLTRLIEFTLLLSIFIKENINLSIKHRICFIGICIVIALFAVGGMLFSETYIGDQYISGIQGRYFSPLLPCFFVSLTNNKINIPKKFDRYVTFLYVIAIFEVIIYILSYTFVN